MSYAHLRQSPHLPTTHRRLRHTGVAHPYTLLTVTPSLLVLWPPRQAQELGWTRHGSAFLSHLFIVFILFPPSCPATTSLFLPSAHSPTTSYPPSLASSLRRVLVSALHVLAHKVPPYSVPRCPFSRSRVTDTPFSPGSLLSTRPEARIGAARVAHSTDNDIAPAQVLRFLLRPRHPPSSPDQAWSTPTAAARPCVRRRRRARRSMYLVRPFALEAAGQSIRPSSANCRLR